MAREKLQGDGGRRGIRTPGTVSGSAVFKTAALDHSAILPFAVIKRILGFGLNYIKFGTNIQLCLLKNC